MFDSSYDSRTGDHLWPAPTMPHTGLKEWFWWRGRIYLYTTSDEWFRFHFNPVELFCHVVTLQFITMASHGVIHYPVVFPPPQSVA
jgi:hypothetical protein